MSTLTTTAVLRYSDQMSAGLQATASRVLGTNARLAAGARRAAAETGSAARSAATRTAAMGYGLSRIVNRVQDANDNLVDFGIAALFDSGSVDKALQQTREAGDTSLAIARRIGGSINDVTAVWADLKNAGVDSGLLERAAEDISLLRMTDRDLGSKDVVSYTKSILDLAKSYGMLKDAKGKAVGEQKFITQQLDRAAVVAKATSWDTGQFVEARAKTTGALTATGTSQTDQDILMGMYGLHGINPDIAASTARSITQHLVAPVGNDIKGWNIAADFGINRRDYMSGKLDADTFRKQLRAGGEGQLSLKEIQALSNRALAMERDGSLGDVDAMGELAKQYAKFAGLRFDTEDERAAVAERLQTAISGGGLKFDQIRLFKDAARKMPQEQYDQFVKMINEDKRFSEIARFASGFRPGEDGKDFFDKLKEAADGNDDALSKVKQFMKRSPEGRGKLIKNSLDNISFTLTRGEGMLVLTERLSDLVSGLDDLVARNPQLATAGLALAGLTVFAGPIGLAARGIGLLGRSMLSLGRGAAAMRAGASVADLAFGMGSQRALAKRAAAAQSAAMLAGMGMQAQASQRMIAGMSGAMATASVATTSLNGKVGLLTSSLRLLSVAGLAYGLFEGIKGVASPEAQKRADDAVNKARGDVDAVKKWFDSLTGGATQAQTGRWIGEGKGRAKWVPNDPPKALSQQTQPPLDLTPTDPSGLKLSYGASSLESAAAALTALPGKIVSAIQGIKISPVLNVSGGGETAATQGGKAQAPTPRVTNGQQYNGGN